MKTKITTAFEKISKKSKIDSIMARVDTVLLASDSIGKFDEAVSFLSESVANFVDSTFTDEAAE